MLPTLPVGIIPIGVQKREAQLKLISEILATLCQRVLRCASGCWDVTSKCRQCSPPMWGVRSFRGGTCLVVLFCFRFFFLVWVTLVKVPSACVLLMCLLWARTFIKFFHLEMVMTYQIFCVYKKPAFILWELVAWCASLAWVALLCYLAPNQKWRELLLAQKLWPADKCRAVLPFVPGFLCYSSNPGP